MRISEVVTAAQAMQRRCTGEDAELAIDITSAAERTTEILNNLRALCENLRKEGPERTKALRVQRETLWRTLLKAFCGQEPPADALFIDMLIQVVEDKQIEDVSVEYHVHCLLRLLLEGGQQDKVGEVAQRLRCAGERSGQCVLLHMAHAASVLRITSALDSPPTEVEGTDDAWPAFVAACREKIQGGDRSTVEEGDISCQVALMSVNCLGTLGDQAMAVKELEQSVRERPQGCGWHGVLDAIEPVLSAHVFRVHGSHLRSTTLPSTLDELCERQAGDVLDRVADPPGGSPSIDALFDSNGECLAKGGETIVALHGTVRCGYRISNLCQAVREDLSALYHRHVMSGFKNAIVSLKGNPCKSSFVEVLRGLECALRIGGDAAPPEEELDRLATHLSEVAGLLMYNKREEQMCELRRRADRAAGEGLEGFRKIRDALMGKDFWECSPSNLAALYADKAGQWAATSAKPKDDTSKEVVKSMLQLLLELSRDNPSDADFGIFFQRFRFAIMAILMNV